MSQYYIENTTRSPHTRSLRKANHGPESSTKNLFIGGGAIRVVRGRPFPVTEKFLYSVLAEIADKEAKGLVRVLNANRKRIDIKTIVPVVNKPYNPFSKVSR